MKLLLNIFCLVSLYSTFVGAAFSVRDYKSEDYEVSASIALEDTNYGFKVCPELNGSVSTEELPTWDRPLSYQKVAVDADGTVVAIVAYSINYELSRETLLEGIGGETPADELASQTQRLTESLKPFDKDCEYFAEIAGLAVSKKIRRNGLGRKLVQAVEHEVCDRWSESVHFIQLTVYNDNLPAIALYQSEEFREATKNLSGNPSTSLYKKQI